MNLDALPPALRRKLASLNVDELPDEPTPTPQEEAEAVRADLAARRAAIARDVWLRTCPPLHADAELEDFRNPQQEAAARAAWEWLRGDGLTFVLAGPVGVGKSRLACAIGNRATAAGTRPVFISATGYLKGQRPEGDARAAREAMRAPFLVLDDLGVTKGSEWAADTLTDLMEHRLNYDLRTVATTNVTGAQLRDLYGARLMDRLNYRAGGATITGASRRA